MRGLRLDGGQHELDIVNGVHGPIRAEGPESNFSVVDVQLVRVSPEVEGRVSVAGDEALPREV